VKRRTESAFRPVYYDKLDEIHSNSYRQRVPGMTTEDIEAEMAYCLWVAYRRYDHTQGVDFGVFWWSVWLNHRASWIRMYNAQKRAAEELPFSHDELIALSPITFPGQLPMVPEDILTDKEAQVAWSLLALGYLPSEVQATLHLNNHKYYQLIDSWKTPQVHDWLTCQF